MRLGFKASDGMETSINESFANYRNVGFSLIMDTTLAPLILLGDCGKPNIGFGSHDGFSFCLVFSCFGLRSM